MELVLTSNEARTLLTLVKRRLEALTRGTGSVTKDSAQEIEDLENVISQLIHLLDFKV